MKKFGINDIFTKKYATLVAVFVFVAAAFLASSCQRYEEEPPKYEKNSDYLIPSSETPTAEERAEVNAIVNEYLSLYM